MTSNDNKRFRVFATSRIGDPAENRLRQRGYELEVFQGPEAPPKKLIIEKVKSGIDGLITTLRDPIDAEIFEAGKDSLKIVAQIAVGFDNINRADANKVQDPVHQHRRCSDRSDGRVRLLHDGDVGAQDVAKRAPGSRTEVAFVASIPAVPWR
jgi:lactate dehydrogenase-like 2-hydroxyacid dehydrogenase